MDLQMAVGPLTQINLHHPMILVKVERLALNQGGRAQTACAILDNGSMKCWGQELYGMLGNGGYALRCFIPHHTINFGRAAGRRHGSTTATWLSSITVP